MNRVLIAGAGAEVDLGFKSGLSFTHDTFYRQKVKLNNALDDFYKERLSTLAADFVPSTYKPVFLFDSRGAAFKKLIDNLVKNDASFLTKTLEKTLEQVEDDFAYTKDDYKKLFNILICDTDDSDAAWTHQAVLEAIPEDAHFGVLEQYYSALLNPSRYSCRFWKLVNFYWSAFFSIALPITNELYGKHAAYKDNRYSYVLENLDQTIHGIFDEAGVLDKTSRGCYYSRLRGKFSKVITTNFTPYAASVVDCNDSSIAWLGGKLSQFEHLPELEFYDYSSEDRHIEDGKFVFPYLLCQSPVKPVISLAQVAEYAKAAYALRSADEIVVLGYSFCNEDAHICSMVGESLRRDNSKKLVYCSHCEEDKSEFNKTKVMAELKRKLRIDGEVCSSQVEVLPLENCESSAFVERCETWS